MAVSSLRSPLCPVGERQAHPVDRGPCRVKVDGVRVVAFREPRQPQEGEAAHGVAVRGLRHAEALSRRTLTPRDVVRAWYQMRRGRPRGAFYLL